MLHEILLFSLVARRTIKLALHTGEDSHFPKKIVKSCSRDQKMCKCIKNRTLFFVKCTVEYDDSKTPSTHSLAVKVPFRKMHRHEILNMLM